MKTITLVPLLHPVKKIITVPGSKSYTNRALVIAAMTKGKVIIKNPLISDDTIAMMECLKTLGIKIVRKSGSIEVLNDISSIQARSFDLHAKLSGTTIRFLLAFSTIIPGIKTLRGDEGLNKRPIKDLVDALRQLGAKIEYVEKEGYPPVKVTFSHLQPHSIHIKGSVSSQYLSAILMIAPCIGEVVINVEGKQSSKPFIDMTTDIMEQFGVMVENNNYQRYVVPAGQKYRLHEYIVEGDVSSASYFLAIAVLTKSTISIKNLNPYSVQADMGFMQILVEKMGCKIITGKNQITVIGNGVKPVSVDMANCPDQAQTLAVLAAFAKGVTKITGIGSLRLKETERIKALQSELLKMGIKTTATNSSLTIYGGNPKPAQIKTYGDHRMAMAFAVAGSKFSGMSIEDPEVVNKTFPDFWEKLNKIGIEINSSICNKNIVLIGMRGSGKTAVGNILAQKLKRDHLELDVLLSKKLGISIAKIVEKKGWDFFRDEESKIVREISVAQNKIISTGGGVVTRKENVDALKKNGILVLLNASVHTLLQRVGNDTNRPFLTDKKTRKEEMKDVFRKRKKLYKQAADVIINTDSLSAKKVAQEILLNL